MKKFLLFVMLMLVSVLSYGAATALAPGSGYDKIETSYTQTTISQDVVFNSTMQAGGSLTFSVNATSGGGIAGNSEPVSLSLVFYSASGTIIKTVNSSTTELATPSTGWVTETMTVSNCGGSCSNVAYVQVQMHGIDGSYWAGDYGPQYYAPSLSYNGGSNILYNPQFGPAPNGTNVQGWNSTAGWGVCQGAYGGSNDCVVNTAGITANAGNYIASGGSTSAPAGGTPAAPTVVSTTTTTSTQNLIIGTQQVTVSTPTTTTTYSNGTQTTTTGSSTQTVISTNTITGAKFGAAQVADTQWNVYACTQTNTCNIYSTNPGLTWETGSPTYISSTQYITLIPNTGSNSSTDAWTMILVNSDGTYTVLGTGNILVEGTDSSGNVYLFFSNDNDNGTLLSANLGLSGQGVTFTGMQDPTIAQTNSDAANFSTSVLAAGQTGGTLEFTPITTNGDMNVAGSGSTYAFFWKNMVNTSWAILTSIQPGWYWTCATCQVTSGTVASVSVVTNYSPDDSLYITFLDANGNPIDPESGAYYTFSNTPAPVLVSSTTTNQTTTSSSTGNTTTVTNTINPPSMDINGMNTSNYTFTTTGVITPTITTTTVTPVTTNTYSDGSTTTSDGTATSTQSTTYSYSVNENTVNTGMANPYANTTTNGVYITQVSGSYTNVLVANQYGQGNLVAMYISGEGNNVSAEQGFTVNTINVASQSTASDSNTAGIGVIGNNNNITTQQVGNSNTAIATITGNNNSANIIQTGNSNQSLNLINGNGNALYTSQTGNNNLSSINLYGNGNSATVTQSGTASMSSILNLTNAGGANNVSVTQTGATSQSYVLQQSCGTASGCSVSVHQGN